MVEDCCVADAGPQSTLEPRMTKNRVL